MQLRLDALKYGVKNNDDDYENKGSGCGGGGGGDDGMASPDPPPPRTPQQEMKDIVRRLDILRGNTPDVSPSNTPTQNSRIIARQNEERFQNRQIREREREISNIPKRPPCPRHLLVGQIEENSMTTRIFLLCHIFLNQLALLKQVFYLLMEVYHH